MGSAFPYIRVHPRVLQAASFPPFDTYIRPEGSESFKLFKAAGEPIYADTWRNLDEANAEALYVPDEHADRCFDYVEENFPAILEQNALPVEELAEWLYWLSCRAMAALLQDPRSRSRYERVHDLMRWTAETIHSHPGAEWHMIRRGPLTNETHVHCVNVSVLLASLARRGMDVRDKNLLSQVLLGGILHDVGKTLVPPEILEKPGPLTSLEFRQIERHPRDGLAMARPYLRNAPVSRCIIEQHHEDVCGGGYPDGRSDSSINLFARAARIVDVFDALTSHRPYRSRMDAYDALNKMVTEMREKFDDDILRRFIANLPPGLGSSRPVVLDTPEQQSADEPATDFVLQRSRAPASQNGQQEDRNSPAETAILDPDDSPEERAAPARPIVNHEPTMEERKETLEALATGESSHQRKMRTIMNALGDAIGRQLRTAGAEASPPAPEPEDQPAPPPPPPPPPPEPTVDRAELDLVQSMLAVAWELDAWRRRFKSYRPDRQDPARMHSEVLACLATVRAGISRVLRDHRIQLLDDEPDAPEAPDAPRRSRA